jgi:hypothetical protein
VPPWHASPPGVAGHSVEESMAREPRSAQEIQAEVHRLIHETREVRADRASVDVPLPVARPADGTGLNWWMSSFGNAMGYQRLIGSVVAEVGKRWNLQV